MPTVSPDAPTAICSSSGESTCTPLLPPDNVRKGSEASGARAPFTRRALSTRTPLVPPWMVSSAAAGSQRTSGASTRRLLTTSRFAVTLLDELKVPLAAVLPTRSWAKSAVVALRVLAAATVTSRSRLMPPSAKEASRAPSSFRTVTRAFWICKSPAALCSWGVSTKLVAVSELTVRSAVGSTPGLFSRSVTLWPRELKLAMRG